MGYHTDFYGEFKLDKPLKEEHKAYLDAFAYSRRVQRDEKATEAVEDPVREAAGLPVGEQGCYAVFADRFDHDTRGVSNYNVPPVGQPGLWCQWVPNEDGTAIVWDESEKFYNYVEWIEYLIANFLYPWGYVLNGEVSWRGGEDDDRGTIYIKDNEVRAVADTITNENPFK